MFKEGQYPTAKELNSDKWSKVSTVEELAGVWRWDYNESGDVVLKEYLKGDEFGKVEIPRTLTDIHGNEVRVELESLAGLVGVTHVQVAKATDDRAKVKLLDTNVAGAFNGNDEIEHIDFSGLEVENVTSMTNFAQGAYKCSGYSY